MVSSAVFLRRLARRFLVGSATCVLAFSLAVPLPSGIALADPPSSSQPLVVFLVRHAEKESDGSDPPLSEAGKRRAEVLARVLRSAGIEHIHSSNFKRTRNTATPLAAQLKLEVELYDARDLPALIAKLRQVGGRHLVVGHSNTTPECVQLLGGAAGEAIDEATEYDRLYVVTAQASSVQTVLLRYGEPAEH